MLFSKAMLAQRSSDLSAYRSSVAYPRALALDHPEHIDDHFLHHAEDVRASIDKDLLALRNAFALSQTDRNALSPICRLPSELLAQIFAAIDDTPRRARTPTSKGSPYTSLGWINVTHVCRHWRYVALEYPRLWRNISFTLGSAWTSELLLRSKAVLISLSHLTEPSFVPFDAIPLASHLDHTEHIHIRSDNNSMRALFKHLSHPAPHLRGLHLTTVPTGGFMRSRMAQPVRLPAALFEGVTPALEQVSLTRLHVPWAEWPFRGLRHLAVTLPNPHLLPLDNSALPTLDQLLDVLSSSPDLETLRLGHTIPPLAPYTTSLPLKFRTVRLPNFKELFLEGRPLECANLLRSLQIPRGARVKLDCASEGEDNDECDVLLALIRKQVDGHVEEEEEEQTTVEGRVTTLWIKNYANHVAITTWAEDIPSPHHHSLLSLSSAPSSPTTSPTTSPSSSDSSSPLPPPAIDISFTWPAHITRSVPTIATPPSPQYINNPFVSSIFSSHSPSHYSLPNPPPAPTISSSDILLNNICSHLGVEAEPGRDVRTVIISTSLLVTKERWREAFGEMKGLRGVGASGEAGIGLIEAMDVGRGELEQNMFLPCLECVELYAVDFRSRSRVVSEDDPKGPLSRVMNSLRTRQASGRPLKTLKIAECTVKEEWVEEIKRVMGRAGGMVEWDGSMGLLAEASDSGDNGSVRVWS
ncbi:uncharacterized protein STEHIDRAFT_132626 [Stereum hirsutum FP-91666 SS1]|uniref:uncharacterized protein n=1 Tax=Stereum hirsutum (strain FP-91666) TaxID=721885 RepID=UPI000444A209|nr:uncharacterized protein STEHIDRAFT_132626 [Stereum hirsutum FP-91666 SS1]EIM84200.1 hypothetical protein STEHIDRAFT_132626 [Stereum hirsutum FP-91666 SS1]